MQDTSLITRTEREIYLRYEHQRRVQMLQALTPAFIVLASVVFGMITVFLAVITLPQQAERGLLSTDALLVAVVLLAAGGLLCDATGSPWPRQPLAEPPH